MQEIWKDIPNYEGYYQVSNLGRVKSLKRKVKNFSIGFRFNKEIILKANENGTGYLKCVLCLNAKTKTFRIHQLVAMAFLNHKLSGYKLLVNHINFNKLDNRVENLEIVTARTNSNRKHLKSTSKYVGVYYHKQAKKWISRIHIKGKQKYLGLFKYEYDAHIAYQKELKKVQDGNFALKTKKKSHTL